MDNMEMTPMVTNLGNSKPYLQWSHKERSFENGNLSVDFVLVYENEGSEEDVEKRKTFEKNLENVGLKIEREKKHHRLNFVKLHVPKDVLCQYAELLKLRLPIKDDDIEFEIPDNILVKTTNKILDYLSIRLDPKKFKSKKYQLTAEYRRDKPYLFDSDAQNFFDTSVRTNVASYILEREKFVVNGAKQEKGIKRLLSENVYAAAYPLHDGDLQNEGSKRKLLSDEWASVSKFLKYQPIDEIKDYFGIKYALYFTWLGFYTVMLIPPAIVGICCLIYAATTLNSDSISQDICNLDIIMCPRCNQVCDYWELSESCTYAKVQHFVDNPATIFFALFMSFWAVLFLELWKRYSADISHRWGLVGFDLEAEPPRPEYLAKLANAKKLKINAVTQLAEPAVPFWSVKLPSIVVSFGVALLLIFAAVGVVFGVVIYRMSLTGSSSLYKDSTSLKIYVVPVTAGVINLVCIVILNLFYEKLAYYLTEKELQRTQTEHDESLALKIYMFQFVNYYSSIFYIAFLKGKFVGYPAKVNKILGYRQEECSPGGCLMELTIQLAIIMIGNQAKNAVVEMIVPLLKKKYKTMITKKEEESTTGNYQWLEDYKLSEVSNLFSEYLEMVLQYGFVTIFITAFPLAPLFALINNILEMRLDAKKFVNYYRRPVPQRVKDIGIWMPILGIIGRISVVSNAFIIAFSSHFIPRIVYMTTVNTENHTDEGFLDYSLSYFNTSDFLPGSAPENSRYNVTECRYADYRNPHSDDPSLNYKRPIIYWHILAARLAFVVVYQNFVTFLITAVEWIIPDISRSLKDQIKREIYKTNEMIIRHEENNSDDVNSQKKLPSNGVHNSYYDSSTG